MPELPEVENVRRTLDAMIRSRRVTRVDVHRADVVVGASAQISRMLVGQRVTQLLRHGKQLAILGEPTAVGVHLGMTGSVRVYENAAPLDKHTHVVWHFESGHSAAFRDPRRFGGVWVHDDLDQLTTTRWCPLGPDALTISVEQLAVALEGSKRPLKAALLDQFTIAGLGNIYVDELLFQSRLHPLTHAARLKLPHIARLVELMHPLLRRAIDAGGSTLRDYADARGQAGGFQHLHQVYGRGGQPCVICATLLSSLSLAGRTTVFCPSCQKRKPW